MTLLNLTFLLFFIMNALGNISSYLFLTGDLKPSRQYFIIIREMLIALLVMIALYFIGEHLCTFLCLSPAALQLAAGLILFLHALKILFPAPIMTTMTLPKGEPLIFPLAIPLIAGPALMASILLFSNMPAYRPLMLPAIGLAWLGSICILYFSHVIERIIGKNGLTACERLLGMVLVIIAVQFFLNGIQTFWIQTHLNK